MKAKLIVPVADSSCEVIVSKGISPNKIYVIKNGVNVEETGPEQINKGLKSKHGLENKFIVSYFGTLGLSHALKSILETAQIAMNNKDIFFLFIGSGAEKNNLLHIAKQLQLNNVLFLDPVKREQLSGYYSITDLQIVSLKNIELFKKVIPSKIFEIMSYQKPILLSVNGEARKIIEDSKSGLFVEPENPHDLFDKIILLKNDSDLSKMMAKNGRIFVEKHFDRKKLARKYYELIEHLLLT